MLFKETDARGLRFENVPRVSYNLSFSCLFMVVLKFHYEMFIWGLNANLTTNSLSKIQGTNCLESRNTLDLRGRHMMEGKEIVDFYE